MSKIIGIDFGTTKTIAAVLEGDAPVVIPDRRGRASMPSLVLVTPDESLCVGWEAREHTRRYEGEHVTINSVKRALGRQGETAWGWLRTHPQAVAALIIGRMKLEVESRLGQEVRRAVVAIPAHFDFNQRWSVKQAAEAAGLEVLRLVNEATAAAMAYSVVKRPADSRVLVCDFGGGTLDVSVLELGEGVCEVKATAGDGRLGGEDFDQVVVDFILERARDECGELAPLSAVQQTFIREAAAAAKIELSAAESTRIYLPGIIRDSAGAYHNLDLTLSREEFYRRSGGLLERAEAVLREAVKGAGVEPRDLAAALIVGGTSRIPCVRDIVRRAVGLEPHTGIDPETCVAQGAAVLAGVLAGEKVDFLLLDTYPNALSVGMHGGGVTRLIEPNTTIPTLKRETFGIAEDNQTQVDIGVYEGNSQKASENTYAGKVTLAGIPPAPARTTEVEVAFQIDANGLLMVSASCGGRNTRATLAAPNRLGDAEMTGVRVVVARELAKIKRRLALADELEDAEAAKREARACAAALGAFLERRGGELPAHEAATLGHGLRLAAEYVERDAPREDLRGLVAMLAQERDRAVAGMVAARARALVGDEHFGAWAAAAAAEAEGDEAAALDASLRELRRRVGEPFEQMLADLREASGGVHFYESVRARLGDAPAAWLCLRLVVTHFDPGGLAASAPWPLSPSEEGEEAAGDDPAAAALLLLLRRSSARRP